MYFPKKIRDKERKCRRFWDLCNVFLKEYFSTKEREEIRNYFSKKNFQKNIDIGGGGESYIPNSYVLDFSRLNLKNNPEKNKILFNLNHIREENLPFRNSFFNSATLVGVWPYLNHPTRVLKELERILEKEGKIYVITNNSKKIGKMKRGPNERSKIERVLSRMEYEFKTEKILQKDIEAIEINLH